MEAKYAQTVSCPMTIEYKWHPRHGCFECERLKELQTAVQNLYDETVSKYDGLPLKEWLSRVHDEWLNEDAASRGQHGLWRQTLLPYIAAYMAGLAPKLSRRSFVKKYGIDVPDSSYSDWTKYYLKDTKIDKALYHREEIVYWWRIFGMPETEYAEILKDMEKRGLL